jgi:hypothetical protein
MRVAFICPVPLLRKYGEVSDYHLVLAHLVLKDPAYADFYRSKSDNGEHILLDNGMMELGAPLPVDDLLRAADIVHATEVVAPDYLSDGIHTWNGLLALYQGVKRWRFTSRRPEVMFIPQGSDILGWLMCFDAAVRVITRIGIPKSIEFQFGLSRPRLVRYLAARGALNKKVVHLFGVHRNPAEVRRYSGIPVYGIDMKLPILAGQLGIEFDPEHGLERRVLEQKGEVHLDFYNDQDHPAIMKNIRIVQEWAKAHDATVNPRKEK